MSAKVLTFQTAEERVLLLYREGLQLQRRIEAAGCACSDSDIDRLQAIVEQLEARQARTRRTSTAPTALTYRMSASNGSLRHAQ